MKRKGTRRDSFDTKVVETLLEKGELTREESLFILGEANHVIGGLRVDMKALFRDISALTSSAEWIKDRVWQSPN